LLFNQLCFQLVHEELHACDVPICRRRFSLITRAGPALPGQADSQRQLPARAETIAKNKFIVLLRPWRLRHYPSWVAPSGARYRERRIWADRAGQVAVLAGVMDGPRPRGCRFGVDVTPIRPAVIRDHLVQPAAMGRLGGRGSGKERETRRDHPRRYTA